MSASARARWRRLWSSPIGSTWESIDGLLVERLVALLDVEAPSGAVLTEIRQIEDRLGLSPLARRRLGYVASPPKVHNPPGPTVVRLYPKEDTP